MTRPRTVSDEAILAAARSCAVERGPAVPLDVIANRVGLTSPALLKRFGTRQELMIAALRPIDPPAWVAELADGPDDRPLAVQLRELIDRILHFFSSEMPCLTALSESGFPVEHIFDRAQTPPPIRSIRALAQWLARAAERGLVDQGAVEGNDFESVAAGLLGALHGRVFLSDFLGATYWRRSRDEYVADIARIYTRALSPVSRSQQLELQKRGNGTGNGNGTRIEPGPHLTKPLRKKKKS